HLPLGPSSKNNFCKDQARLYEIFEKGNPLRLRSRRKDESGSQKLLDTRSRETSEIPHVKSHLTSTWIIS
ncbi:hypothetical protein PENTCL1PPCAC_359, partial [Pristionchus entomophagus]